MPIVTPLGPTFADAIVPEPDSVIVSLPTVLVKLLKAEPEATVEPS